MREAPGALREPEIAAGTVRSQSLTRRLPILIVALITTVAATISWAAYSQVRLAVLDAASTHLSSASKEIAGLLQTSARRLIAEMSGLASATTLTAALSAPGDEGARQAGAAIEALHRRSPQYGALSLWDRRGTLVASAGPAGLASATPPARATGTVTPFRVVQDTIAFDVVAPVLGTRRDTLGILVGTRRLTDAAGTSSINRLLGADTRLIVGNADGSTWSDLAHVVKGPSPETRSIGAGTPVPGTPWLAWVEMPLAPALISIREFLWQIVLVGVASVLVGGIGVWLIVRSAVRPLWRVRASAEALAAGGSPEAIDVKLADEVGALALTFNRMAERVRGANEALLERAEQLERRNHELRQSELRYRRLVDQSPEAIIVHRDGSIVFANPVAAQLLGASDADALRGTPILDRVASEDRELAADRIAAIAATRLPSPAAELRMRRMDGSLVNVEVTGTAIEFDGAPAVQTWARDITNRLSLEAQLRQSQKMEAMGRLAGGVAHDFNNLLSVIRTYADLTIASMDANDPNRPGLEDIRHAATSAAQLTKQMLAFSRKQVLNPQILDLNEAIAAMTGMLHRTLGDHIDVQTSLRSDLAPVWADASQLEQILVNLAVNARDAMPQGGTIRIETANVSLDVGYASTRGEPIPPNDYVMLAVSDTGSGMTSEVKANIFEPFFTTKDSQGTGLGLATVYGIVKQSGGHIWVYSEPGQGTSFKLFFPQHRGSETPPAAPDERPFATPRNARVLLVEDDAMVRTAVRRILERSAFGIIEAESGVQGVEVFAHHDGAFDLVITDMMMPGMTGTELIRRLRERSPDLRAIIMSGYSEETTAREWRLPPNASFIEKPISPRALLRVIDEVLGAQSEAGA